MFPGPSAGAVAASKAPKADRFQGDFPGFLNALGGKTSLRSADLSNHDLGDVAIQRIAHAIKVQSLSAADAEKCCLTSMFCGRATPPLRGWCSPPLNVWRAVPSLWPMRCAPAHQQLHWRSAKSSWIETILVFVVLSQSLMHFWYVFCCGFLFFD
jgi:hypothetical protein